MTVNKHLLKGCMVPHKLLIEFTIETSSEYKQFIGPLEVVRGETYLIKLFVTNLGTDQFPGSDAIEMNIDYRPQGYRKSISWPDENPFCPEIKPGEKVQVFSDSFMAINEGEAWITAKMKAKDEGDIKYYQSPTSPLKENRWENSFYVVSKEFVRLMAMLDKIVKQLE